jgi:hypothetical protein
MSSPEPAAEGETDSVSIDDTEQDEQPTEEDKTASPTVTGSAPTSAMTTPEDDKHNSSSPQKKKRVNGIGTASAMNKTYIQLVQEAIVAMKDRTGSSLAAIKKYILQQYPDLGGPHFASRVNTALKKYVQYHRENTPAACQPIYTHSQTMTQKYYYCLQWNE